jgi:hypothetical protein
MTKSQNKPKGWLVSKQQIVDLLAKASSQLAAKDKENLVNLDYWRKHPDEKPEFTITSPFQDVKTNVTFYRRNITKLIYQKR